MIQEVRSKYVISDGFGKWGTNLQLVANLPVTQAYRELGIVKDPTDKLEVETPLLPEGKYNVIYADPSWSLRSKAPALC